MTIIEALHKMEFMRDGYQKLLDENISEGILVGIEDVTGTWNTDTPLTEVYTAHEACEMAISALYKQEPMRPRKNTICYPHMPDVTVVLCPTCNRRLRTKRTTAKGDIYCPDCGQHIDWSE